MRPFAEKHEILIENSAPESIDYVSIDTQGCEWFIMKDFPFKKWSFKIMALGIAAAQNTLELYNLGYLKNSKSIIEMESRV